MRHLGEEIADAGGARPQTAGRRGQRWLLDRHQARRAAAQLPACAPADARVPDTAGPAVAVTPRTEPADQLSPAAGPGWHRARGCAPTPSATRWGTTRRCASADHLNRLLYAELKFQLPPNDLMKVDRTFMYNGVAGRSPLLDRRVVEFAASLPACWKRHGRTYKWFLRQVAADRIPPELVSAPKVGLAVPLRAWLRGELGERVADVVSSSSFQQPRHLQYRSRPCRRSRIIVVAGETTDTRSGRWLWSSCGIGRSSTPSTRPIPASGPSFRPANPRVRRSRTVLLSPSKRIGRGRTPPLRGPYPHVTAHPDIAGGDSLQARQSSRTQSRYRRRYARGKPQRRSGRADIRSWRLQATPWFLAWAIVRHPHSNTCLPGFRAAREAGSTLDPPLRRSGTARGSPGRDRPRHHSRRTADANQAAPAKSPWTRHKPDQRPSVA